ncbi:MAG: helix-turn-helix domain-containing protein [Oscillospiraceae bacterium]
MNYISQINYFYLLIIQHPIPSNAQALWHRLMAYCNSFGWKDEFSVSNGRLAEDLGISKQSVSTLRKVLERAKLITYKENGKNKI